MQSAAKHETDGNPSRATVFRHPLRDYGGVFAEDDKRVVENSRGRFERQAVMLPLVDAVPFGIPFKSHRYTSPADDKRGPSSKKTTI